jgi:hypothetical protein
MDPEGFSEQKVVVNTVSSGIIKGFLQTNFSKVEELLAAPVVGLPERLQIRSQSAEKIHEVSLNDTKAVFFVESFEGQGHRRDVRFHTKAPLSKGIWIHLEFHDGEILEGIVPNTIHHLVNLGLFVIPTDPSSNNRTVYVLKSAIKNYHVLGVRNP